jgi:hypothetical protein
MRAYLLFLSIFVACLFAAVPASADDTSSHQWQRPDDAAGATLSVSGPEGTRLFTFAANQAVVVRPSMLGGDGLYHWQLNFAPTVSESLQALAAQRRAEGESSAVPGWPAPIPASAGLLAVQAGLFAPVELAEIDDPPSDNSGEVPNDQVIADDLIVQGSTCSGFDCINNESFGVDTLRLKENNLRINFDDTSSSAGFPANDWRIVANDQANGGVSYLAFEDSTAARIPFLVEAGAPTDALRVDSNGNIGFGTAAPVLDLHAVDGDTPGLRLDQDGTIGFTPQIWDVAGNEANFFIRDVTGGSRLPFRIRPGAPTSSIDIEGSGDVGFGIASPASAVHIRRAPAFSEPLLLADVPDDGDPLTEERRLALDNSGNLFVGGTITQLSSRHSKENLVAVAGSTLLSQLRQLNLWTWNYRSSSMADRHMGPVAEDFYRMFGLGSDERSVAPADMAGVALAASQALSAEIVERDRHIAELEARIARLETALERIAGAKN